MTNLLNTKAISIAFGMLLIGTSSLVQAISLDDFVPPVSGGADQPATEVTQSGDVVTAQNMQDGLSYAYQQLVADGGNGILTVQTKTGMGIISSVSLGYTRYENLNATLLSKRGAYFKAFNTAQQQLVEYFEGFENNCNAAVSNKTVSIDSGQESLANSVSSTEDSCKEITKGMLAGYVTYSVNDDVENDEVTITLASSTKTRSALTRVKGAIVSSQDPKKAFEYIAKEISLGVVPPMGAKLINDPETGESIVIGFGSSIIRQNKDKNMMRKLAGAAQLQSRQRANSALIAFLQGSTIYWEGGFDEQQVEAGQQFEVPMDQDGNVQDPVAYDATKNTFLNSMVASDEFSSVTGGKLPAGVITKNFPSEDGYWSNTIAIYRSSASATAQKEAQENTKAVGAHNNSQRTGRTMTIEGGITPDSVNPKGPSGSVVRDNDF